MIKLLVVLTVLTVALGISMHPSDPAGPSAQESSYATVQGHDLRLDLAGSLSSLSPTPILPGLQPPSPDTVFAPDNRTRVTPTTSFPWSAMAKLLIYTDSNDSPSFECSGVLVSPFHVLTAGHCVNDPDFSSPGHYPLKILVIPASEWRQTPSGLQPVEPYGHAFAKTMRALPNWLRSSANYQDDLGLLTLDTALGNRTGWMDLRADFTWSPTYLGTLYTAGYPGDKDDAHNLYKTAGRGCRANEDNLWYTMDTFQGQSGSPVFAYVGQTPYVLSIVTYGSTGCNIGTRLGEGKMDALLTWMKADNRGTPPISYVDLLTPAPTAGNFTPTSVTAGVSHLTITHQVVNQGTASSGSFNVAYYASSDPTIDSSDLLLGTQAVDPLAPSASTTVRWSGTVPSNLTAGRYWIGWIIGAHGDIHEIDEENNAGYVGSSQLAASVNPLPLRPASLAAAALLIAVPIAILVMVLLVSRRRPVTHPPWAPQLFPPPPPATDEESWRYCAHCGTPFIPDLHFCVNCGAWLQ